MSSSSFSPKKQAFDWLTYMVYQLEACFFWRETTPNNVLTWISEKNWLLVILLKHKPLISEEWLTLWPTKQYYMHRHTTSLVEEGRWMMRVTFSTFSDDYQISLLTKVLKEVCCVFLYTLYIHKYIVEKFQDVVQIWP